MMMKPKLFLHVGVSKTGSTALQTFFANNFSLLEDCGILYPNADGDPVNRQPWVGNVMTIGDALWKNEYDPTALRVVAHSMRKLADTEGKAVFFSSEQFSLITQENIVNDFCEIFTLYFRLALVVVVRDPLNWYYSRWKQEIKAFPETRSFEEFLACEPNQFPMVRKWLGFAEEAHFLSYEAHRKDLLKPFLEVLGAPSLLGRLGDKGTTLSQDNRSFTDSELQFFLLFNGITGLANEPNLRWKIFSNFVFGRKRQVLTNSDPDPALASMAEKRHEDFFQVIAPHISRKDIIVPHPEGASQTPLQASALDPEEICLAFSAIAEHFAMTQGHK